MINKQIILLIVSICFFNFSNILGQTPSSISLEFIIFKDSTLIDTFTFDPTSSNSFGVASPTTGITTQLCPGDQLTIVNRCTYNGSNHNFDGSMNTSSRSTIGLTNSPASSTYLKHIGHISATPTSGTIIGSSWNWGESKTITLPPSPSSTGTPYLMISDKIFHSSTPSWGNAGHYLFIPLNLPHSASIANQTLCPGNIVDLDLDNAFTYSNWSPNNPDGIAASSTQTYTVTATHNTTGCVTSQTFTLTVRNPDVDLAIPATLCANEAFQLLEEQLDDDLSTNSTTPKNIRINGNMVIDFEDSNTDGSAYVNSAGFSAGVVLVTYEYNYGTGICSKTYPITILPEIEITTANHQWCNNNFQTICATNSGTAQPGVSYEWSFQTISNVVSTNTCFTPTAYGNYSLVATDNFGCFEAKSFTVSDPGVGINHPGDIRYCSLDKNLPSHVGWDRDPFASGTFPVFNWTYTPVSGSPLSFSNNSYQIPFLGAGTYTVVVTANGCTETFTITASDFLQIYNNHVLAGVGATPILGTPYISCQPTASFIPPSFARTWTVTNSSGTVIPTIPYNNGVRFPYVSGEGYLITFTLTADPKHCQIFRNSTEWSSKSKSNKRSVEESIEEVEESHEVSTMKFSPNPTTSLVNIFVPNTKENCHIQIVNALGQVVIERNVIGQEKVSIDLNKQPSGIYVFSVTNGTTQYATKIIKQ